MSKCLVKKLGSVILNDSLSFLDGFVVEYNRASTGGTVINLTLGSNSIAKVIGNGYFTNADGSANYGNQINIIANIDTSLRVSSEVVKIVVIGLSKIKSIYYNSTSLGSGILKIDYDQFVTCKGITSILLSNSGQSSGNITSFAQNLSLITLWLYGGSTLTGTVEEFVQAQWGNGRRSGSLSTRTTIPINGHVVNSGFYTINYYSDRVEVLNATTLLGTYNGSSWIYA